MKIFPFLKRNEKQCSCQDSPVEKKGSYIWELVKIFIIALVIVVPIRYFLFQPFIVEGDSMIPSFSSGDYLIVDEISYRFNPPQRGDVIVFKYPKNPAYRFIKRIVGLPGETIEIKDGQITIYGKNNQKYVLNELGYLPEGRTTYGDLQIVLGEKEYFVLGDNRSYSSDSRVWGSLPEENIIGKASIRLFPLASLGWIMSPNY